MKRLSTLLGLVLALLFFGGLATTANAETHWRHYGADRAYPTRAAAVADAERVLLQVGWPPEVVRQMVAQMRAGEGERYVINNGDHFDFMRSGPSAIWRAVSVAFVARPAVNMEVSAPAERFVVVYQGRTYEAFIPRICNNLLGRVSGPERQPCAVSMVRVSASQGDARLDLGAFGDITDAEWAACPLRVTDVRRDGRFSPGDFHDPVNAGTPCPFDEVSAALQMGLSRSACIRVSGDGWMGVQMPIRLATDERTRFVACKRKENGQSTYGQGVPPPEWRQAEGQYVSSIYASQESIPEGVATDSYFRMAER